MYSTESLHKLLFQMLQEEWNLLVRSNCSCKKVSVMTLGSVHQGSFDMTGDTLTFWWQLCFIYWKNCKTQINSCTGFLLDPTFKTVIIASFWPKEGLRFEKGVLVYQNDGYFNESLSQLILLVAAVIGDWNIMECGVKAVDANLGILGIDSALYCKIFGLS